MTLRTELRLLLEELPRIAISAVVKEKLNDCGIHDDEPLVDALTHHLLTCPSEKFNWNDDKYQDLRLSFVDSDFTKALQDVEDFLKNDLSGFLTEAVDSCATIICKELCKNWPEQSIFERNEMQGFRDRLQLRWCKGLDPLRMLLICAREINGNFFDKLQRSKAKTGLLRRHVLILLHMRACQTTMEVISLLENGLADGAFARWRTLYEIGVVASLIDTHGDDIAQRYLDHDCVAMKRSLENALKHDNPNSTPSVPKRTQKEIIRDYNDVIAKYGPHFNSHYGWASHHLCIKNPTFQELEIAAGGDALPPIYKWASFKVHAGVSGLLWNLGDLSEEFLTLLGASNAGIEEPAVNTAYSLTQVTSLLYGNSNKLEDMIELAALCKLRDRVTNECTRAARKLDREERQKRKTIP